MKSNPFAPVTDPVCKMKFPPTKAAATWDHEGKKYYFCNIKCKEKFAAAPQLYLSGMAPQSSCCCCAEAFEDDYVKVAKRQRKLLQGFVIAAVLTLLTAAVGYIKILPVNFQRHLQFIFASVTVFGPGGFLLLRGVKSLKGFKLNMFTLISLGISMAYFYSVYALFFPGTLPAALCDSNNLARLHFVPAGMIAALVILGQYLEARASAGASQAVRSLMELVPPMARRVNFLGKIEEIPLSQVVIGNKLKVLPHDKIPVDGVVVSGSGTVDESMLTGESLDIEKNIGDKLAAGTVNGESVLFMQAQAVGSDTLLAKIVELVKTARNTKLPIQKVADKVSAVFVPLVLLVAILSLLYWGFIAKDWSMALANFISVLLAACPCSLGLAAPLAVMVGIGSGARHGILIKDPSALEDLRKVDTLLLDKTGTLTENMPQLDKVYLADSIAEADFFIPLLALEQHSKHPLAKAFLSAPQAADYGKLLPKVESFVSHPGQGISGIVNGKKYYLGSIDFTKLNQIDCQEFLQKHQINISELERSIAVLSCDNKVIGMATISDKLRDDAAMVIAEIKKQHIHPIIISGDTPAAVKAIAWKLGIEEYYAGLSPQQKLEKVKAQQAFGRCVAMVGDGVNDAAALAAADVGIAMGNGTDAALENAGVTLLAGNIGKLAALLHLERAVNDSIKLNLMLAFVYNILLIPLAAGVFYTLIHWQFSPVASSIAMSGSCLLVVGNSLRLWKLKLNKSQAQLD